MEYGKFILLGEDKKTLGNIKNALVSSGHSFVGYARETSTVIRHVRSCMPDFIILDVCNNFKDMRQSLEVIDEELLSACILVLDTRQEDVFEFIRHSRVMTYIAKPVFDESIIQIADLSIINFRRILEYEERVKKLNNTLESRKVVEKAKWLLVTQEGMTETAAYDIIRKKSRDNRLPMRDIAEAIIMTRG
ncbi:MAG: ANTAR domain-containing protein [Clostridia bacterium]|nr:ANTAR domain-containing protein [Clostridia bacterium]